MGQYTEPPNVAATINDLRRRISDIETFASGRQFPAVSTVLSTAFLSGVGVVPGMSISLGIARRTTLLAFAAVYCKAVTASNFSVHIRIDGVAATPSSAATGTSLTLPAFGVATLNPGTSVLDVYADGNVGEVGGVNLSTLGYLVVA